jgi:NAD+ synthase
MLPFAGRGHDPMLTLGLAQINPTVGDVAGNIALLRRVRAEHPDCDLIVGPELSISGYPPEDLVLVDGFLDVVEAAVQTLAADTVTGPALLVGAPYRQNGTLHNAILLLDGGQITAARLKTDLPNYGPFDEKRVFRAGPLADAVQPIPFRGRKLGIVICEDMWTSTVAQGLAKNGADILIVPNGSPFDTEKAEARLRLAQERVRETGLALLYVNLVGGQDELVFDGGSFVLDAGGAVLAEAARFEEDFLSLCLDPHPSHCDGGVREGDRESNLYAALRLGLQDYVRKNGFDKVWLGLSGGIDSALVAALAVDALGAGAVQCVMMPSPYTSPESLEDAAAVATLLGCPLDTISIEPAMAAFGTMLSPFFAGTANGLAEENIQSRARGLTLMALSNKQGGLVLATGNKSEMAMGYATLYGDMCGGYAPLKDVYKTDVFRLSRWRGLPDRVLTKPPSAELKPNQRDDDTLPPYDVLDDILAEFLEGRHVPAQVTGHDPATVARVWTLLHRAEYKRRQAPPGPKVTTCHLTKDRRVPITNGAV